MADPRPKRLLLEAQGFLAATEANHDDTMLWMAELKNGHPRAQDFEPTGHGGSDPTSISGITPDTARVDRKEYDRLVERLWRDADRIHHLSKKYQKGVRPKRKPDDAQDVWCVLHLQLDSHEPRYRNDLCRACATRKYQTGDFPSLDDVRHHIKHGRWPRNRVDPKSRVDVMRIAGVDRLQLHAQALTAEQAATVLLEGAG